jgi:hypothetical protein
MRGASCIAFDQQLGMHPRPAVADGAAAPPCPNLFVVVTASSSLRYHHGGVRTSCVTAGAGQRTPQPCAEIFVCPRPADSLSGVWQPPPLGYHARSPAHAILCALQVCRALHHAGQ